jgi:ribosomal protein S18 acetylase RimI-like enzyme/predicted nucleic acid-binding protein
MGLVYRAERDPAILMPRLASIRALADSEKEALGFIPEGAYRDAIAKRRLIAMCAPKNGNSEVVGFILFSGVFPNARIQQIAVDPAHRRTRIASTLINDLVSQLESQGYLTITAAVASDLPAAQAFYAHNGFEARRSQAGGQTRQRTIVLRARDLETESFFSILEPSPATSQAVVDLGLRQRSASQAPLYAIDLNVLFDAVKEARTRSPMADRLVAAALGHRIRLAVAPEFIVELERTSRGHAVDPILSLAKELPRLPVMERGETDRLAALVHNIVFVEAKSPKAGSVQAVSDARHLAQAALARASGYVTSDGDMLAAREKLLQQIGIDVADLDEFSSLLPVELSASEYSQLKDTDCTTKASSVGAVRAYLQAQKVPAAVIDEFCPASGTLNVWRGLAVTEAGEVVAIGATVMPNNLDAPARVLVHVRSDHVSCEIFADHLLDTQCQEACRSGPITIELPRIAGQAPVRKAAILRGFLPIPQKDTLIKVALGRPVTMESWTSIARQTRRRTGLRLPEAQPDAEAVRSGLTVHGPDGKAIIVRLPALEDALTPTILLWPGRDGVIVPIAKNYADELLGTGDQIPLFGSPEATFLALRTYFNSPRTAPLMRPGVPMLFYESKRSGGRGAVIAAGRIVDATVMEKRQVPDDLLRRAVVEDLDHVSAASTEVLATTFDNLLRFPALVTLDKLRELGAEGNANLQTTTAVSHNDLTSILELGWNRAGRL